MTSDDPEWKPDRTVTLQALARIDTTHSHLPTCWVCDQHVDALDKNGLCSKTSPIHVEARTLPSTATLHPAPTRRKVGFT